MCVMFLLDGVISRETHGLSDGRVDAIDAMWAHEDAIDATLIEDAGRAPREELLEVPPLKSVRELVQRQLLVVVPIQALEHLAHAAVLM